MTGPWTVFYTDHPEPEPRHAPLRVDPDTDLVVGRAEPYFPGGTRFHPGPLADAYGERKDVKTEPVEIPGYPVLVYRGSGRNLATDVFDVMSLAERERFVRRWNELLMSERHADRLVERAQAAPASPIATQTQYVGVFRDGRLVESTRVHDDGVLATALSAWEGDYVLHCDGEPPADSLALYRDSATRTLDMARVSTPPDLRFSDVDFVAGVVGTWYFVDGHLRLLLNELAASSRLR